MVWLFEDEEDAREFEKRARSILGAEVVVVDRGVHPKGSVCKEDKTQEDNCA
jgi:hypothetical protein